MFVIVGCPLGAPGHGLGPSRAEGKGGGPGYRAEPDTGAPLLNVAVINLPLPGVHHGSQGRQVRGPADQNLHAATLRDQANHGGGTREDEYSFGGGEMISAGMSFCGPALTSTNQ